MNRVPRTPGARKWLERRSAIEELKGTVAGSPLHDRLMSSGVDPALLEEFLRSDRSQKDPSAVTDPDSASMMALSMVGRGGVIAGGAAFRMYLDRGQPRDYDVFFRGFPAFVQATLESRMVARVDVCLYDELPWESFDLTPSQVSFGSDGFSMSDEAAEAMDTGIGRIRHDAIFNPAATLRRVVKYGSEHGFRFPASDVIMVAAGYGVRKDVVEAALSYAV